jgi:hypothetical protein
LVVVLEVRLLVKGIVKGNDIGGGGHKQMIVRAADKFRLIERLIHRNVKITLSCR